jgi:hypothetical protein
MFIVQERLPLDEVEVLFKTDSRKKAEKFIKDTLKERPFSNKRDFTWFEEGKCHYCKKKPLTKAKDWKDLDMCDECRNWIQTKRKESKARMKPLIEALFGKSEILYGKKRRLA